MLVVCIFRLIVREPLDDVDDSGDGSDDSAHGIEILECV